MLNWCTQFWVTNETTFQFFLTFLGLSIILNTTLKNLISSVTHGRYPNYTEIESPICDAISK